MRDSKPVEIFYYRNFGVAKPFRQADSVSVCYLATYTLSRRVKPRRETFATSSVGVSSRSRRQACCDNEGRTPPPALQEAVCKVLRRHSSVSPQRHGAFAGPSAYARNEAVHSSQNACTFLCIEPSMITRSVGVGDVRALFRGLTLPQAAFSAS